MNTYQKPSLFVFIFMTVLLFASCGEKVYKVRIETEFGNIDLELFNSTPQHRDNFVKLVKEGYYDDLLFHRVIRDFMIQGGDPDSRNAPPDQRLGGGGPGYLVPAEIGARHFRGALAAARRGGPSNPEKASSGSQFYIVQGKQHLTREELAQASSFLGISYRDEEIQQYLDQGGYPSLDKDYTVFGKVVSGMEVVDKIAEAGVNAVDRPLEDIKMKIRLIR